MSNSDFNTSYIVVFLPSCNKDSNEKKLLGFWKTQNGALTYMKNLMELKSLSSLSKFIIKCDCCEDGSLYDPDEELECQCSCHLYSNLLDEYCFDSLCDQAGVKINEKTINTGKTYKTINSNRKKFYKQKI